MKELLEDVGRGPNVEWEGCADGVGLIELLDRQDRVLKVAWKPIAKDRAKYALRKAASVAEANHGFLIGLIDDAQARRKLLFLVQRIAHIRWNLADAGDLQIAGVQIQQSAISRGIGGLRKIEIPAKAHTHGQIAADAPGILAIEECPLLSSPGVCRRADAALEVADLAEHECGQSKASLADRVGWARCVVAMEEQGARAIVAGVDT